MTTVTEKAGIDNPPYHPLKNVCNNSYICTILYSVRGTTIESAITSHSKCAHHQQHSWYNSLATMLQSTYTTPWQAVVEDSNREDTYCM